MHSQQLGLFAVTETHLRNAETIPDSNTITFFGNNRKDGEKQLGGVGFFCHRKLQCKPLDTGCTEHLWLHLQWQGLQFAIAVIYMAVEGTVEPWNSDIYKCLHVDI